MQRLTNGGQCGTLSVGGGRKEALMERNENGNENVHFHNLFYLLIMQPICYQGGEEVVGGRKGGNGGKEGQ